MVKQFTVNLCSHRMNNQQISNYYFSHFRYTQLKTTNSNYNSSLTSNKCCCGLIKLKFGNLLITVNNIRLSIPRTNNDLFNSIFLQQILAPVLQYTPADLQRSYVNTKAQFFMQLIIIYLYYCIYKISFHFSLFYVMSSNGIKYALKKTRNN